MTNETNNDFEEIKNTLIKRRYHQKLLLNIACHDNPDELLFFQQIISYDLDEKQVKSLLNVLLYLQDNKYPSEGIIKELKEFDIVINEPYLTTEIDMLEFLNNSMKKLKVDIPLKYLLISLERQSILTEISKKLLNAMK